MRLWLLVVGVLAMGFPQRAEAQKPGLLKGLDSVVVVIEDLVPAATGAGVVCRCRPRRSVSFRRCGQRSQRMRRPTMPQHEPRLGIPNASRFYRKIGT